MDVELTYPGKRSRAQILEQTEPALLKPRVEVHRGGNWLIHGENLGVLAALRAAGWRGKVDLVYIDPPYATNTTFRHAPDRTATVSASNGDAVAYEDRLAGAGFLEFLRERLVFLHEMMAPHASIFLHIDCKVGHYVKVIMDEVFGPKNFRNDIARIKCNPKNFARKGFGNIRDMVLFYSKSDAFKWHEPKAPLTDEEVERLFPKADARGRRYTTTPLHAPGETRNGDTGRAWRGLLPPRGRHWRYDPKMLDRLDSEGLIEWSSTGNPRKIIYADEARAKGKKLQDVWEFKDPPYPSYPTEKNLDMLRAIIGACSDPGDLVLDCFCGSGTTLLAAQEMGRRWIGIDESPAAIRIAGTRLAGTAQGLFADRPWVVIRAKDVAAPARRVQNRNTHRQERRNKWT